jgi:hypothetical protein
LTVPIDWLPAAKKRKLDDHSLAKVSTTAWNQDGFQMTVGQLVELPLLKLYKLKADKSREMAALDEARFHHIKEEQETADAKGLGGGRKGRKYGGS